MSLPVYLKNKLGISLSEANIIVKHVRKFASFKENIELFTAQLTIYLDMDGVITDFYSAQRECVKNNIDKIYSNPKFSPIIREEIVNTLFKDVREGNTNSFFKNKVNVYINKSGSNIVTEIYSNFQKVFIEEGYFKKLKVLKNFDILALYLIKLKRRIPNLKLKILSSTGEYVSHNEVLSQKLNWLNTYQNKLSLDFDGFNMVSDKSMKKNLANSSSILIDDDIYNCLEFEEAGGYSIFYDFNNPQDAIDDIENIVKNLVKKK